MILRFPGTRGEIEESSRRHTYNASLVVQTPKASVLIDFGEKYDPALEDVLNGFDALLITHAHPDHYIWTKKDASMVKIPVYLTRETFDYSKNKPRKYRIIDAGKSFSVQDLHITAHKVLHSFRCPAVCYKMKGLKQIVYAPDLIDTQEDKQKVLAGTDVLIADGSSLNINMVRRRNGKLFGHTQVKTMIGWCKKYRIPRLIITHCGKQIVTMDRDLLSKKIMEYSQDEIDVAIAVDGLCIKI